MKNVLLTFMVLCFIGAISCSDDNTREIPLKPNDPTKPIQLTDFMPDSGGVATQMMLYGSNFGTDKSKLKVYFNKKQASIIRTIGDAVYVLAPRLPGDTCFISVVMGDDSLVYEKPFYYRKQVIVSTIAGVKEEQETKDGTLVEARFDRPFYLAVDKEKNIIVGEWKFRARLVNEARNSVTTLLNIESSGEVMSGCTDSKGEVIYFPVNGAPYYFEFDPEKQWLARRVNPTKLNPSEEFNLEGKYSLTMCELDSMLYTITTQGDLVKINPRNRTATLVVKSLFSQINFTGKVQAYLCFHPIEKDMLYIAHPSSMAPQDGPIQGTDRIYRMSLKMPRLELFAGSGVKGKDDGPREQAEFNNPCQICFDKDGVLYVGDTDNYCVRRISTDGIVSTVVGIPGKSGNLDGAPDVALFNRFWGMKIDDDGTLYIADYYNQSLRKLTIQ